jgi:nitrate reductase (cytochrome), electron transfer subunit
MKSKSIALLLLAVIGTTIVVAQEGGKLGNGLRGPAALTEEPKPAPLPRMINDDKRRTRGWPAQPPVIPHQIENYQVDRQFNKCMSCHGRERIEESRAPMVSVTHFTDREGNHRSEVAPQRYFCTQCHVPQMDVGAPVKNTFQDAPSVGAKPKGDKR